MKVLKWSGAASLLCLGIGAGAFGARGASSTAGDATWVQPATFTLTAYSSSGNYKLNNKAILNALKGATNSTIGTNSVILPTPGTGAIAVTNDAALGLSTNAYWFTNLFDTNDSIELTNFPSTIDATNSMGVSVVMVQTTNNPPTYVFTNITASGTYFTNTYAPSNAPATYITAVFQTTSSSSNQVVFYFYDSYETNIVGVPVSSGPVSVANGASLVLVTTLADDTSKPLFAGNNGYLPTFAIKTGSGKNEALEDISPYIYFTAPTNTVATTTKGSSTTSYGVGGLVINIPATGTNTPISVSSTVFFKEVDGIKSGTTVPTTLDTTVIGTGTYGSTSVVVNGTVNMGSGAYSAASAASP